MYSLKYMLARKGKKWAQVDLGDTSLCTVYSTYQKAYAILTNPFVSGDICINLDDFRSAWAGLTTTLNEWLAANGSATIKNTSAVIPRISTKYVRYSDAFKAGYKVQSAGLLTSPDAILPSGDKTALFLSSDGIDFTLFAKYCMVSVNGFFHFVDANSTGAWVHEGMVTRNISLQNQLGIYSFADIGIITHKRITSSMIYKQSSEQKLRHRLFIDLGEDITNKTVALVVGGYLHICDPKTFYPVGDSSICVEVENMPIFERFHETLGKLDLSSLPVQYSSKNPTQVAVEDLLSDENLTAYFTLNQSFVVLIDNPEVYVEKDYAHTTKMPGMYVSFTKPLYPLIHKYGQVAEYWDTEEHGQWAVNVRDNFKPNRVYNTVPTNKLVTISDSRTINNLGVYSKAHFMKIGSDLQ